jgi:dATP pyrophosphohydrolase
VDFWQSVTGSLERDESPPAAAERELSEETGLSLPVRDCRQSRTFTILPEWRGRYAPDTMTNCEHVFAAVCEGRPDIRLNPREHVEYCWLPRKAAAAQASSWTNRDAILALVPAG